MFLNLPNDSKQTINGYLAGRVEETVERKWILLIGKKGH